MNAKLIWMPPLILLEILYALYSPPFTNQVAYFLRHQPYQVNLVFGGVDDDIPSIYFIDYLGVMQKMNYASHGYGSYILLSLFDRLWKVGCLAR